MFSICAIFKNEYPFILEWLAYHRCLGIKDFYIADNVSTDRSSELLIALEKIGIINRFHFPTLNNTPPQIQAYNYILSSIDTNNEWLAFIDADEFITPSNFEKGLGGLKSLFEDDQVSGIALNWAVYGSSCAIIPENLLVIERLNKRAKKEHPVNLHYKSIIRKRDTISAGKTPHKFVLDENKIYIKTSGDVIKENSGLSKFVDWDIARINHYVIKSKAEFITKKIARGRATTLESQLNRTISFFRSHDLNQDEDNIPRWFINKVENEKASLLKKLTTINYQYSDYKYITPLYRTSCGMGKGHIDKLNIHDGDIEIYGWAIDKMDAPINNVIAVVDSTNIIECSSLLYRDRMDLARAKLGNGIGSGFNAKFPRPKHEIGTIDFYGLDSNGLVVVEIKSNIDILLEVNAYLFN